MKKFILFLGLSASLMDCHLQAQNVGIGTATPDASAKLDVVDANRGILIPRVALSATNVAAPVTSPATSLLVYNTATAGSGATAVTPGYYYWSGTQWVRIDTGGDWKLDGNTNGAIRSIGTNDNYDFPIETNGTERMRVTTGGNVGIATTTPGGRLGISQGWGNWIQLDDALNGNRYMFHNPNTGDRLEVGIYDAAAATTRWGVMAFKPAGNIGFGTNTPDASALIDMTSTNRGLLIPRVALTATNAATPVTSPATSLLVYNTATAGSGATAVTPGYYYWDGTQWVRIDTGGDWKLDGNTNGAIRSIGTNDNFDFPIETNGTEKMRITTAGNVGIGTTTPNAKLSLSTDLANVKLAIFDGANDQYGFGVQSGLFRFNIGNAGARYGFFNDEAAAGTEVMTIQGNGNVGIGTTTPAVRLHVPTGNIYGGRTIRATAPSDGTNAGIFETYNETNNRYWHITQRSGDNDKLIFWRNNGTWADVLTLTMDQSVGIAATNPDPSAILEVRSTNRGVLLPRMTTAQRDAIPVSAARQGLLIYNTDRNCFEYFDTRSNPTGLGGFWNSLCDQCERIVVISTNQTGFNLNAYVGGAGAFTYCVFVQSGVTLQAAGNGGGPSVAGNPGFNASSMPLGSRVFLYNYGTILAGGGNGGQGGREGDGVCQGDASGGTGGRGGDAILTNSSVPVFVYNYGTIRAGGGGGGGGAGGCCSAGGGGGGGAGTPAGAGGWGNSYSCVGGFVCLCGGRSGSSSGGNAGTALTGGTGAGGICSGGSGCPGTGSGCGGTGGTGGVPAAAGNAGTGGCCVVGCGAGAGGGAGYAVNGSGSGSQLVVNTGTVTGTVVP